MQNITMLHITEIRCYTKFIVYIYLINHIVSVNTTNKFKFYCDMFRPHRAIIRLTKKCL